MEDQKPYMPFSQRNGFAPIPSQFELGVVPPMLRLLIQLAFQQEIERNSHYGYDRSYFEGDWKKVAIDCHVILKKQNPNSFENSPFQLDDWINRNVQFTKLESLFDLVEFFIQHKQCSPQFKQEIQAAFVNSLSAYRIYDNQIIPIGSEEQGLAFAAAIDATDNTSALGARQHLISAGTALKNSDWASSIRESIHAVESVSKLIEPSARTLGPALTAIEKSGYLHPSMKEGFQKLYGYTNDEKGIRHAAIDDPTANADETDALFMLGACASFVSYLLARKRQSDE
jgi:hypothetical protein